MGTGDDITATGAVLPSEGAGTQELKHDPQRVNCQCARCKAVVANWHAVAEAEARGEEVLLLPHSTVGRLAVFNRSPWFNERKLMHEGAIETAEEEASRMIKKMDKPDVEVKITERHVTPGGLGSAVSRFEVDVKELDKLLKEANGESDD